MCGVCVCCMCGVCACVRACVRVCVRERERENPNNDHQWQRQKMWHISCTTDPENVTINAHFVVATFAFFNNALTHPTRLSFEG